MTQRVVVKVVGFTDVERHALNTLFRLAEEGAVAYAPWVETEVQQPQIVLVDARVADASSAADVALAAGQTLIWVGPDAPAHTVTVFQRPLVWPEVIQAMDAIVGPVLDFDLDLDAFDTQPPPDAAVPRVLIASADRDQRLYMRAKLSLAGLTQADEAATSAQALELVRTQAYAFALVDFRVTGDASWDFFRSLRESSAALRHVIVTKRRPTFVERMKARAAGAAAVFDSPPHPGKLHDLLLRLR